MFCSAMKHSMKLSGYFYCRVAAKVDFLVSPSSPTTFSLHSLAFLSAFPQAFLVEINVPRSQQGFIETCAYFTFLFQVVRGGQVLNYILGLRIIDLNDLIDASNYDPRSLPCQSSLFSTFQPRFFPLIVLQTIAQGLAFCFRAFCNALDIYSIECPSTAQADHPNDSNLFRNKSGLCLYIVGCDCPSLFISTRRVRLSSLQFWAKSMASQMLPSAISPSPVTQYTLLSILSKYLLEYAMPAATESPWPNDPVATSTNGTFGVGCPQKIESLTLRDMRWHSSITLARYRAEYKMGAAWPLDRTSLSFKKWRVSWAWNFRPELWKNSTENSSAREAHEEGCPLLVT